MKQKESRKGGTMTKEKSTVPRLRFPGFTTTWKQRKLGEEISFYNGRAYKQSELLDVGKYKVVRVGNFNTNEKWYYSNLELEDSKTIDTGDLIYLWATSFGPEIWKGAKSIYHYHIWKLIIKQVEKIDKNYLYTWLYQDKEKIAQNTNGSTMVHITKKMIENRDFEFPTLPEQEAIGSFFSDLDQLITLHQRKLDDVKELKKALLQKMFPKGNGNDFPELRFPEFTDAWKQRKFSDLAEVRRGLTYSPSAIRNHGVRVLRSSNINEDTFVFGEDDVFVDKSVVKIPLVEEGDILITSANGSSRLVGKHSIIKGLPSNSAIHGGFMLLASSKVPCFLNAFMSSTWYHKFIGLYVAGGNGAIGNLNKSDLDEQIVLVPTLPEQEAIGSFFSDLDQLITLHQRQLDHLKLLKKALLQQMFI
ncbi:TPA: restriction endonuclease subunit S [Streptococcus suis]|nr:restriction endonuclease subunit S [Streptococcus suis]HEM5166825.1 restriction endonuclease subunit S [Streptococcus suis]HEM5178569.1 restriction endonuclease subunit S [Streptococcus suis]